MAVKFDPVLGRVREKDAGNGGGGGGDITISDVAGLQTALDNRVNVNKLGAANGVPTLDENGKIPQSQVDYGYQPGITTIPAATASYNLADGGVYQHEPDEPPTYNLPTVSDSTKVHEIEVSVKFSTNALSCVFMRGANVVVPKTVPPIVGGMVVHYACRYEPLLSSWVIECDQPSGRNVPPNDRMWYSAASKQQYSGYTGNTQNNFANGEGEVIYATSTGNRTSGNVFRETAVTSVSMPDNIVSISEKGFEGCSSLVSIRLPAKLGSIQLRGFYGCSSLALTELPSTMYSLANWAFRDCTALALTSLPPGIQVMHQLTFLNCVNLALTALPSGVTSVEQSCFKGCISLAISEIPAGVTAIEASAFEGCTGLTELTFLGTPESISETAFKNCTNITSIKVPWASTDTINANAPWGATNATITYNYTGE